jgi:hypothetical protein
MVSESILAWLSESTPLGRKVALVVLHTPLLDVGSIESPNTMRSR